MDQGIRPDRGFESSKAGREGKGRFAAGIVVGVLVTVLVAAMFALAAFARQAAVRSQAAAAESQAAASAAAQGDEAKLDIDAIARKMKRIQYVIEDHFLFEEDPEKVETWIYTGMMYGLDDPYSVYFTPEDYEALMEEAEGTYAGIGAMVSQDTQTGVMSIVRVFADCPAFEAGMLPGDILYKVDDLEVTGMDLDLVVKNNIRGRPGSTVTITVLRGDDMEEVPLTIKRRMIEVPTVEHEMLAGDVGYVSVLQFDGVTTDQFIAAVEDLQGQGMEKLVIDLRGNPGGVLDVAVDMMAYVLPDGLLIYTEDKNGLGEKYYTEGGKIRVSSTAGSVPGGYPRNDGHELDIPIAVLIDGSSASASEVFAGALKDYKKAVLVGTTTFGKGIVQQMVPLGDGSALKITIAHYYTPMGNDVHEKGIEPDIEVELSEELRTKAVVEHDEDNVLQAAIAALE
ncbi:MAG: S41 family peptidase [Lachnospiraceae bacterium]|nr:S41 family peptidase [Lachnospiraceae bacterium]